MKTEYGAKIVLVVASSERAFMDEALSKFKDSIIPAPVFSHGVVYTKKKNYRFVHDINTMRGLRGVEVEFWQGSGSRSDYEELFEYAEHVRRWDR